MKMTKEQKDELYDDIEKFANGLIERGIDSVVILTTSSEGEGGTAYTRNMKGNSFANREAARSYLSVHENEELAYEIVSAGSDDE
jgi:hypothetical protein